jgi:hypothetical protein
MHSANSELQISSLPLKKVLSSGGQQKGERGGLHVDLCATPHQSQLNRSSLQEQLLTCRRTTLRRLEEGRGSRQRAGRFKGQNGQRQSGFVHLLLFLSHP